MMGKQRNLHLLKIGALIENIFKYRGWERQVKWGQMGGWFDQEFF